MSHPFPTAANPVAATTGARKLEYGLLAALFFCLPLFEAPKNIFWGLYLVTWFANRVRARNFGGRWDVWDTLITAWIASGFVVAAFAGVHHKEWLGPLDLVRYGSVLWLLKRSRLSEREIWWLLGALAAGTALALLHAYWRLLVAHSRQFLELNSVGFVNHSAIFLAILLGAAVSVVAAYWHRLRAITRAGATMLLAFFAVSLFVTQSRTAIAVALALVVLLGIAWWPRSRRVALATILATAAFVVVALVARVDVVIKHEARIAEGNVLAYRVQVWNTARAIWQRFPLFGVGMDNYSVIESETVHQWRAEAGKPFDENSFKMKTGHAHSLYYNTLAERGTVGFAALAAVLLAWAWALVRRYPGRSGDDRAWALWGGALSGWFMSVFAGVGNTTLHHEHALLAMLLLGLWLGGGRRSG